MSVTNPDLFDPEQALELAGGDQELLAEVARLYLDSKPAMIDAIRAGVAGHDAGAVCKAAHKLKGSLLAIAAKSASEAAENLERLGAEQRLDRASEALAALEREIERIEDSLAKLASGAP
jgi:HPt (histidine-containing phosphotransfer) domain-containing protein